MPPGVPFVKESAAGANLVTGKGNRANVVISPYGRKNRPGCPGGCGDYCIMGLILLR